jgi:hypothetical protein
MYELMDYRLQIQHHNTILRPVFAAEQEYLADGDEIVLKWYYDVEFEDGSPSIHTSEMNVWNLTSNTSGPLTYLPVFPKGYDPLYYMSSTDNQISGFIEFSMEISQIRTVSASSDPDWSNFTLNYEILYGNGTKMQNVTRELADRPIMSISLLMQHLFYYDHVIMHDKVCLDNFTMYYELSGNSQNYYNINVSAIDGNQYYWNGAPVSTEVIKNDNTGIILNNTEVNYTYTTGGILNEISAFTSLPNASQTIDSLSKAEPSDPIPTIIVITAFSGLLAVIIIAGVVKMRKSNFLFISLYP